MTLHRNAKRTPSSRLALVRRVLFEGYYQVDEKLVDRPPRYWVLGVCAAERFWDLVVVQCSRPVPQEGQTVGTAVGF